VLVAMLLPALAQARETAKRAACSSNLKQIGSAFEYYLKDYSDWYPIYITGSYSGNPEFFWYQRMSRRGYLKDLKVLFCPSHLQVNPEQYLFDNGFVSYGYNVSLTFDYTVYPPAFKWTNLSQIGQPSKGIFAVDAQHYSTGKGTFFAYPSDMSAYPGDDKMAYPRHTGICDVVWLDSHVTGVAAPIKNDYTSIYMPGALTSIWMPWGNINNPWNPRK
jgi:hypothetical protein